MCLRQTLLRKHFQKYVDPLSVFACADGAVGVRMSHG